MTQDILKKLDEKKLNRRSFLRGSGLAVAAFAGVAAMSSLKGFAQEQDPKQQQQQGDKKDDSRKKDDGTASDDSEPKQEEKVDAQGREYRTCPQCGFNMYRQGRTWTCENCGYSYVE